MYDNKLDPYADDGEPSHSEDRTSGLKVATIIFAIAFALLCGLALVYAYRTS